MPRTSTALRKQIWSRARFFVRAIKHWSRKDPITLAIGGLQATTCRGPWAGLTDAHPARAFPASASVERPARPTHR